VYLSGALLPAAGLPQHQQGRGQWRVQGLPVWGLRVWPRLMQRHYQQQQQQEQQEPQQQPAQGMVLLWVAAAACLGAGLPLLRVAAAAALAGVQL